MRSLHHIVKRLDEERRIREESIDSERRERLAHARLTEAAFTSSTLGFAGFTASLEYHLALCVSLLARHVQELAAGNPISAIEANAVKELAASLVMVHVAFKQLIEEQDGDDQVRPETKERVNTAGEIFGICSRRFEKSFMSAGLPPLELSEVLGELRSQVPPHE